MSYAVFAVTEDRRKVRVTEWNHNYAAAHGAWTLADRDPNPAVKFYAVREQGDEIFGEADNVYEPELARKPAPRPRPRQDGDRGDFGRVSWRKLGPIRGFTRTADEWSAHRDHRGNLETYGAGIGGGNLVVPQYRRMVRCNTCGIEIAALGVGYHRKNQKCQAMKREGL